MNSFSNFMKEISVILYINVLSNTMGTHFEYTDKYTLYVSSYNWVFIFNS